MSVRAFAWVWVVLVASCGRRNFNDDAMPAPDGAERTCGTEAPPNCTNARIYECGGECFTSCADAVPRPTAAMRCAAWGGCLATIRDQADNDCAAAQLHGVAWIGLLQDNSASTPAELWRWCDGSMPAYIGWRLGSPNDSGGVESGMENCATIDQGGAWEDKTCSIAQTFVCSRPL